jgi:hypothetical protein
MIGVFVGFSRIFLLGILIFKELTACRLYKWFGFKGLNSLSYSKKTKYICEIIVLWACDCACVFLHLKR